MDLAKQALIFLSNIYTKRKYDFYHELETCDEKEDAGDIDTTTIQ